MTGATTFFNSLGFPCKEHYNPGDHYIKELSIVENKVELSKDKIDKICKYHEESINSNICSYDKPEQAIITQILNEYDEKVIRFLPSLYWLSWRALIGQVCKSVQNTCSESGKI